MMIKFRQIQHCSCFLLSVIILLILSCGDSLNITGITETDETGPEPIGNVDENDWCTNTQDGWVLYPAYPNPADESVAFRYDLNRSSQAKLQIINEDKKVVRLLVEAIQPAGAFVVIWDLRNDKGKRVKNGFYRAQFFIDGELACQGDVQVKSSS